MRIEEFCVDGEIWRIELEQECGFSIFLYWIWCGDCEQGSVQEDVWVIF